MPRPSNKAVRRSQIARGLMRVMAARGYDGASMPEIAKAAGLTQGLIHYHFKNKQEILIAALDELVALHNKGLDSHMASLEGRPHEQLAAFIDFHLGLGTDASPEALACWLVISGESLRKTNIREAFEAALSVWVTRLIGIIEDGNRDSLFDCSAVEEAAAALMSTIQGYFLLAATARSQIPLGSAARSAKLMAEGLLKPKKSFL